MTGTRRYPSSALWLTLVLAACGGGGGGGGGQNPGPQKSAVPARPFLAAALAGQTVSVLPLTLVAVDPSLKEEPSLADQPGTLRWADSVLGSALTGRAPEVEWVLPPELRRMARRAPSLHLDPDRMGQGIMASPRAEILPDPLRVYVRNLVALAGGRMVLIPALVTFRQETPGLVRAEAAVVLADARNGQVLWRTLFPATGATPAEALARVYHDMLPLPTELP